MKFGRTAKLAILAGGIGERLNPLTKTTPKPLVQLEKRVLLDFPVSSGINARGVGSIAILAQAHPNLLLEYCQETYLSRQTSKRVQCFVPPMVFGHECFAGTADAVRQTSAIFEGEHEYVIIAAGDHFCDMDYDELLQYHIDSGSAVTVAVQRRPIKEAAGQLGVFTAKDGKVLAFTEKPAKPEPITGTDEVFASLGIYVFNTEHLRRLLTECQGHDFGKDVIPCALANPGYGVSTFDYKGHWRDVGTILSLWLANMDLIGPNPPINFYDPLRSFIHRTQHLPSVKLINGCDARDSIISDGSIVAGHIRSSVLSTSVRIGCNATVHESVLHSNVHIGEGCNIHRVIVGTGAKIQNGIILGHNHQVEKSNWPCLTIQDGIIVVPPGALIAA